MTAAHSEINRNVLERFAGLKARSRLAHAYLFIGAPQSGKSETALAIAKLVNCETLVQGIFCDACPSCLKITAGTHPDIHVVGRGEKESISIEQIREMIVKSQLKAYEARKKVFIIKEAECLSLEGSNALLKTLEEPSANSLLILTTAVPEKNLDTIKSRCHQVRFFPPGMRSLARRLSKDYSIGEDESRLLAHFSQGTWGRAVDLKDQGFAKKKNRTINQLIFGRDNERYLKEFLGDRQETKEALEILISFLRDLMVLKAGALDAVLIHQDRWEDLKKLQGKYSFSELNEILKEVVKTTQLLNDNMNIKVAFFLIKEKLQALA